MKEMLGIRDQINFHVVHRLKSKPDKSPRVAKYERRKGRNRVFEVATKKLQGNTQYVVHEQFPWKS